MLDFSHLLEFSHNYCVSICAVLVPANVLATFWAIVLVVLKRPATQVWQASGLGSVLALLMMLHVLTWFVIGVIMPPTFVLLSLAGLCLGMNLWVVWAPQRLRALLVGVGRRMQRLRAGSASAS